LLDEEVEEDERSDADDNILDDDIFDDDIIENDIDDDVDMANRLNVYFEILYDTNEDLNEEEDE